MRKQVYFYHVMKTAGTAINFAFFSSAGANPKEVYNILNEKEYHQIKGLVFTRGFDQISSNRFSYGFSHEPFYNFSLNENAFTFTCFRDPAERVISIWNALLTQKNRGNYRPGHKWLGSSFSEFLDNIPEPVLNGYLSMFSRGLCVDEGYANVLTCDKVLLFERLEKDIVGLSRATGWPLCLNRVNVSDVSETICSIDRKRLFLMLEKEYDLYNRVREKVLHVGQ
ncbi:MAG: hypothetical protein GF334_11105 [Candidatus Altiarchaeales archaeon]|nr:hypothetical protein [Candidatus Altiarchaeales archaeon]